MNDSVSLTLVANPSRRLAMAVIAIHLPVFAAIFLAGLGWPWRPILLSVLGFSLIRSVIKRPSPVQLRCQTDGSLLVRVGEDWAEAGLKGDTVVLPWLVMLRYRLEGRSGTETTVLLGDSLEDDPFRRLRVWLRWRAVILNPSHIAA